jgi:hypothetical protein
MPKQDCVDSMRMTKRKEKKKVRGGTSRMVEYGAWSAAVLVI